MIHTQPQTASFGPERCCHNFDIRNIVSPMPAVSILFQPCSEPKSTVCDRVHKNIFNTGNFNQGLEL